LFISNTFWQLSLGVAYNLLSEVGVAYSKKNRLLAFLALKYLKGVYSSLDFL